MSLKAFHFVFVVASILLSLFMGRWCFEQYQVHDEMGYAISGVASIATGALLLGYLLWFLRKTKKLSFLVFVPLLFGPSTSYACSVCMGNPNSLLSRSANEGVGFLLAVIAFLLVAIASVFITWAVRSARMSRS